MPHLRLVAAFLVWAVVMHAQADRIILSTGHVIAGQIELQTSDRCSIRTPQGLLSFPVRSIAKIEQSDDRENYPNQIAGALAAKKLSDALEFASQCSSDPQLLQQCDETFLRQSEILISLASSATDLESRSFKKYVSNRPTPEPSELMFLLCRFLAARGDIAAAIHQLSEFPASYFKASPAITAAAVDLLHDCIATSLKTSNPETGLEGLEMLCRISPASAGTPSGALLYLQQATRLADGGNFLEALQTIRDHSAPDAPALAWDETQKILRTAETRTTESIYEKLCQLAEDAFSTGPLAAELLPLMTRHADSLASGERFDEALRVADRLSMIDADEGAKLSHRIEYAKRARNVAPEDMVGRYKLGVWAREMGLSAQALAAFKAVESSPVLHENASLQIELIAVEREKADFAACSALLDAKQYREAIGAAEDFRRVHPASEFSKRAGEVIELAKYRLWRTAQAKPAEAEALYQNAERLYMQERVAEALTYADRIEADFPDSPAAKKASVLREKIRKVTAQSPSANAAGAGSSNALREMTMQSRRMAEIRALAEGITGRPIDSSP